MIQHHKRLSLDLLLPEPSASSAPVASSKPAGSAAALVARRQRSAANVLDALEAGRGGLASEPGQPPQLLRVDGHPAHVRLTSTGLEWLPAGRQPAAAAAPAAWAAAQAVPFSEMLAVQRPPPRAPSTAASCLPCLRLAERAHCLEVLTFRRSPRRRCEWALRRVLLEAGDEQGVADWAAAISAGVDATAASRPRSLLVLLNPASGRRRARRLYAADVAPLLAAAGIRTTVCETRRPGHAAEMVEGLTAAELRGTDGIVCVGGDGVFHEVLNGLLAARGRAAAAAADSPAAAELLELLGVLRLAHIPAGSTDAVACTLHGSRSAFTAAAHVVLGDRTALDVLRVDSAAGTTWASCIAAYGFLADVCRGAEALRWLGPLRYDLVGAAQLLASRAYAVRVRWLEGEVGRELSRHPHARSPCAADCGLCKSASFLHARRLSEQQAAPSGGSSPAGSPVVRGLPGLPAAGSSASRGGSSAALAAASEPASPVLRPTSAGSGSSGALHLLRAASSHFLQPAAQAAERHGDGEWRELVGQFCSVMLICMPCRSDKTRAGMARFGHLADGRLKLVLVQRCSPLQYLRFLIAMSRSGCAPGQLPYVTVLDAVAAQVEPLDALPSGSGSGGGGGGGGVAMVDVRTEPPPPGQQQQQQRQRGRQRPQGRQSCWNLDGELLTGPDMRIAVEAHHGLLQVFSRGVEQ